MEPLADSSGQAVSLATGGRRARESKQMRALDSLYLRALKLNPLLYRRLDRRLLMAHIVESTQREVRMSGGDVSRSEIDYVVEGWLKDAGSEFRAWLAYGSGNFPQALEYYAQAAYTAFLARASQNDPQRPFATKRLAGVTEILSATPPKP